jgi:ketosteroid isomerase-like protein
MSPPTWLDAQGRRRLRLACWTCDRLAFAYPLVLAGIVVMLSAPSAAQKLTPPPPGMTLNQVQSAADAIKQILEQFARAFNIGDVPRLLSYIAEDRRIDSIIAGAKVSKADYGAVMVQTFKSGRLGTTIEQRVRLITLSDSTHATVDGSVVTGRSEERYQWVFEKRNGQWLIVETTYILPSGT